MTDGEFLVSYGRSGEFGRFQARPGSAYGRGDRVVVRGHRGVELGAVLCPATAGHGRFLGRTALGQLLRHATAEDEANAGRAAAAERRLFDDARRLATELGLPWQVVDAEVLLDGSKAVVHYLGRVGQDAGPFARTL